MAVPTLRRRRLAAELRRLREEAGISLDQAAKLADLAKSTLSRMETAQIGTRPLTVRALMTIYGIPDAEAESLVQLARDARKVGWWQTYSNVIPSQHADYIALESEAAVIHSYEPQLVPGLLQTERYARELIRTDLTPMSSEDLERKVIQLFFFQDFSQSEIARSLNISCNYVGYLLNNGLHRLRKLIEAEELREAHLQVNYAPRRMAGDPGHPPALTERGQRG